MLYILRRLHHMVISQRALGPASLIKFCYIVRYYDVKRKLCSSGKLREMFSLLISTHLGPQNNVRSHALACVLQRLTELAASNIIPLL